MIVEFKYERVRPKIDIPEGFILIQDTREQTPIFKPAPWVVNKGLKTGDYSICGFEKLVTIERKSIQDLFRTLGKGRKRFEEEIKRMEPMIWKGLMIEGCEDRVMRTQSYSKMNVNQIYHALSGIELKGVHIYYAKTKRDACDWILSRLTRFYRYIREGKLNDCCNKG